MLLSWQKRKPDIASAATILISVAALVVIFFQTQYMGQQSIIMVNQWDEMKKTRELENRAWIGVKKIDFTPMPSGGFDIKVVYVNKGKSPAVATVEVYASVLTNPPPDNFQLGPMPGPPSKFAMFPDAEHEDFIGHVPSLPPVNPQNPFNAAYVIGKLEYKDIFDQGHVTRFCYFATGEAEPVKRKGMIGIGIGVTVSLCPAHNFFN